ncbi:hypothetical protein A2115_03180 [Candidatus Woesebacteria bacterium GWA1_41_8]|jgi:hypothetical protein|uniref:Uncharacterized protein n=1 Tax=Candidatus Woesebacteria bacterium GWA1_41_8 TaxID=1802471 RepID=A0A1F7WIE5_9BACT|nr:MAG: hypothetical protein A2115_03180 [Candidatus Woesebacteria bacterium GWA1_41_8]
MTKTVIPRLATDIKETAHAVANRMAVDPYVLAEIKVTSVIYVKPDGEARQEFKVGNLDGLPPSDAIEHMQHKAMRIGKEGY